MDAIVFNEFSPEFAREALIAISECLPDGNQPCNEKSVKPAATTVNYQNGVIGEEECRAKLISISCTQSSEAQPLPSTLETLARKN